jgi:hypothetical protein
MPIQQIQQRPSNEVKVLPGNAPNDDWKFWLSRTPEERVGTVEFLRRQYYLIQGYREVPRLVKEVQVIRRSE